MTKPLIFHRIFYHSRRIVSFEFRIQSPNPNFRWLTLWVLVGPLRGLGQIAFHLPVKMHSSSSGTKADGGFALCTALLGGQGER